MHWSDAIADKIIQRNPDKEEYVCAAGISPSGSIHIGNFRDIATSCFVVRALRRRGKKAKLLFSWDEYDRLRKVPVNVAKVRDDMEQYIGYPYVDVPNPMGGDAATYAEYFEREFEGAVKRFGIEIARRTLTSNDLGILSVDDELVVRDPRRAIQLPADVIAAGLTPNPR